MTAPAGPTSEEILARASRSGLALTPEWADALAAHARSVLRENDELHLTSITEPGEFLERHLGEAFEGAAMLGADAEGPLLDLGSGNGYPGLPLAAARGGLQLVLSEASVRKAAFLRHVVEASGLQNVEVLEAQIQRTSDLADLGPFRWITSRAMGGWAKILPRLHSALGDGGELLVWAGEEMEVVAKRVAWRRLEVVEQRPLPDRERSWIWRFRARS